MKNMVSNESAALSYSIQNPVQKSNIADNGSHFSGLNNVISFSEYII